MESLTIIVNYVSIFDLYLLINYLIPLKIVLLLKYKVLKAQLDIESRIFANLHQIWLFLLKNILLKEVLNSVTYNYWFLLTWWLKVKTKCILINLKAGFYLSLPNVIFGFPQNCNVLRFQSYNLISCCLHLYLLVRVGILK